jgi:hypothetical protein
VKHQVREGFLLSWKDIAKDIFIPRYYDPRIQEELKALQDEFHLVSLRDLVKQGKIAHSHGDYVPKIHYGTGPYPYIRTSDLANWEIKASPKHGVPLPVYEEYSTEQRVEPRDILFVHEGTYLIGAVGMVTEFDGPVLYQHHLAKFTVHESCPFNAFYLLVALEAAVVHRQIRAKQFSADIIDSVVGRLEEIVIPYPKNVRRLRKIESAVEAAVLGRAKLRQKITRGVEELNTWMLGNTRRDITKTIANWEPLPDSHQETVFLGGRRGFTESTIRSDELRADVLLPKYYDPWVPNALEGIAKRCQPKTVAQLVEEGILTLQTGDEIGRLNYGTGNIPFVRTSDFGSWELKREAKQGVSEEVWREWKQKQDAKAGDILLVRDGTYLVGTSVLLCEDDLPLLYCGGIYKIRSHDHDLLPPGLLFALLNTEFLRRQMRNKQFTRDVIDTLGQRVMELVLPIPTSAAVRKELGETFGKFLERRTHHRAELDSITAEMMGVDQKELRRAA